MDNSKQSKQVLLSVIGVAILVVAVVGVSFAFFNYTRTGAQNQVSTGFIKFNSSQTGAMAITNAFPGEVSGTSSVDISINGGTSYSGGLDYQLKAVDVKFLNDTGASTYTGTNGQVPVKVTTTVKSGNLNNNTDGTFTGNANVTLAENAILGTGTIVTKANATANDVSGVVTVSAIIDTNVAITDTYVSDPNVAPTDGSTNGTTDAWRNGRTIVLTDTWNALQTNPIVFKVRVESIEHGGRYVS